MTTGSKQISRVADYRDREKKTLKASLISIPPPPADSPVPPTKQVPGTVYENMHQEIIYITADRAHRYLNEWYQKIQAQDSWTAPLSPGASLLFNMLTSDCKDRFGLSKDLWTALSLLFLVVAVLWLVRSLWRLSKAPETPDQIIEKFKNGSPT